MTVTHNVMIGCFRTMRVFLKLLGMKIVQEKMIKENLGSMVCLLSMRRKRSELETFLVKRRSPSCLLCLLRCLLVDVKNSPFATILFGEGVNEMCLMEYSALVRLIQLRGPMLLGFLLKQVIV